MTAPLLVAESVMKSFGGRRVLTAASLRAVPGQVRVLLGLNGSGKTTLMKIAVGQFRADSGAVHFQGQAYLSVSLGWLARRGVFYLPDRDLLAGHLTVQTHLDLVARQYGDTAVADAVALAGIQPFLEYEVFELSGGETRRAELAVAMARRPTCLLADEPFLGITPKDVEIVAAGLRALATAGCAVIITGHEVPTLLEVADHVTWCTSGTTCELGTPAQARSNYQFGREYLGPKLFGGGGA